MRMGVWTVVPTSVTWIVCFVSQGEVKIVAWICMVRMGWRCMLRSGMEKGKFGGCGLYFREVFAYFEG